MSDETIKLTGTTLTVIALHIDANSDSSLLAKLTDKVNKASQFFHQSPIIIDLGNLPPEEITLDLTVLISHCRYIGLQPMAFKNVHSSMDTARLALPVLASTAKDKNTPLDSAATEPPTKADEKVVERIVTETITEVITEEKLVTRDSKIIDKPIRSGQQVYAEGADLIILAQVSEGAEVIADGNIHVYGALRGRALAGVKGDKQARIFCQQMEAELIAIAGNFLLSDSMDENLRGKPVQISLDNERLITLPLK